MSIKPGARPQWNELKVRNILGMLGVFEKCAILGVRGYYQDSMGLVDQNDRRVYDDAAFVIGPDGFFKSFNFNTDPNGYRKGHGTGGSKGIASLEAGVYRAHSIDTHGGSVPHRALCQREARVSVLRDADSSVPSSKIILLDGIRCYRDTGYFGINIHRGGANSTSSLGCQTVPPAQWEEFFEKGAAVQMSAAKQRIVPYALIEAQG